MDIGWVTISTSDKLSLINKSPTERNVGAASPSFHLVLTFKKSISLRPFLFLWEGREVMHPSIGSLSESTLD